MEKVFNVCSEEELATVATYISKKIAPGCTILLKGDLGAGKTTLVKYLMASLGSKDEVTSPTFSIVNWYEYPLKNDGSGGQVAHIDLYRLEDTDELFEAGIEEIIQSEVIKCIEWPDLGMPFLPTDRPALKVQMELVDKECRKIIFL